MTSHTRFTHSITLVVPFIVALVLLHTAIALGQKSEPDLQVPSRGTMQPFKAPSVIEDSLPNGLRIAFTRVNDVPLVEINMLFDAGLFRDPEGKRGLSQLTARALFRGTATRDRQKISDELASLGSTITSMTQYEFAQVYARTLTRTLPQTLDVLADLCTRAAFKTDNLGTEVKALQSAAARYEKGVPEVASLEALTTLFGAGHPLTRNVIDAPDDLGTITTDDVMKHYESFYRPNNATLLVSGNVEYAILRKLVADRFSSWEAAPIPAARALPEPTPLTEPKVIVFEHPSMKTATVRIAWHAPGRRSDDFVPLLVLNQILGADARSILVQNLGLRSVLGNASKSGYLIYSGGLKPALVDTALAYIETIHRWMAERGPTPEMVAFAQSQLAADYAASFATNRFALEKLQDGAVFRQRPAEASRFRELLQQVTPSRVQKLAADMLLSKSPVIVIAGSSELLMPALQARFGRNVELKRIPTSLSPDEPPTPDGPPAPDQ